jgi:hypothetical protein
MKIPISGCMEQTVGQAHFGLRSYVTIIMMALLLTATSLTAATVVDTLGGGMGTGYEDDCSTLYAQFHTPIGLAIDSSGILYVADRDNNAIRRLDLDLEWTATFATNSINHPVGVAIDGSDNIFVLNRGNGSNGMVLKFDWYGHLIATNATGLTNASGIALDISTNIYVTVNSNMVIRITPGGVRTTIATIPNAGASLQGIVMKRSGTTAGLLAVCDSGRNGIYLINPTSGVVTTNTGFNGADDNFMLHQSYVFPYAGVLKADAMFNQPYGVAEAGDGTLIVTDCGNNRVKIVNAAGTVTNLYGVNSNLWWSGWSYPGWLDGTVPVPDKSGYVEARMPTGVAISGNGTVYTTEDYYHIIRMVTGAGFQPPLPWPPAAPTDLTATAGYGQVTLAWTASSGATNYNIKRSTTSGVPYTNNIIITTTTTGYTDTNVINGTTYYYVVSALNTGGEGVNSSEVSATPLSSPAPTLTVTATNYGLVSFTWSTSAGATSYNIKRSPSSGGPYMTINVTSTSYNDTSVINGTTYYYVVSAVNPGGEGPNSAEVSATPPLPPVPDPQIGYVDFPPPDPFVSVFHVVSSSGATFNNDVPIVIVGTNGSQTFYTYTNTPAGTNTIPNPTTNSPSAPVGYVNGLYYSGVVGIYTIFNPISSILPDMTIKAIGEQDGHPNSAIVTARFHFITGNPQIIGTNAGLFTLNDITDGAVFWYTIDGSDPTNASSSLLLCTNSPSHTNTITLNVSSNFTLKVRAFRDNYQPSEVVSASFLAAAFQPNTISFGFESGEASSDFVGSPGQTFYAPVTLSILPDVQMYSLQFNLTVTNASSTNHITPGAFGFESMLIKPIPGRTPVVYEIIPPLMFSAYVTNPPPTNQIITYDGMPFVDLITANTNINLLGVGWLERHSKTNLYDTITQDLIKYSMAHDTLFLEGGRKVIPGGYWFKVPTNAVPGVDTYQIQIDRPSATSDGIGAPGSSVFIYAPTNGSLGGGAVNSIKTVTIGQLKYLVGNVYPFRWFNAGDFGNTNLQSADVMQVFQSAIYSLNYPPYDSNSTNSSGGYTNVSDFFDAMDSCGYIGVLNSTTGYYTNSFNTNDVNLLFDGNNTTINQIAFGDGKLDVCDVYVTFRRSLDPSLTWYRRFWTNGFRVAETNNLTNVFNPNVVFKSSLVVGKTVQPAIVFSVTNQPRVSFACGDITNTSPGQIVSIPITASVFGNYPLRVLMLNLTVVPLDGSPALTTQVTFTNLALGEPDMEDFTGNGNYSAVWGLNNEISGLTGDTTIGTLNVTIPTNATSSSAYAVHFDHASASPNGIASFPKQTLTGLVTLSSRASSSYNDGIPDSWRLRYFGTVNNMLSVTNADADGDGMNNLQECLAGTDPVDPTSFFKNISTDPFAVQQPQDCVISWPSVIGRQYVIERSTSLFPPDWTSVSTNSGTGTTMEFHDTSGGGVRFYRVQVLQ